MAKSTTNKGFLGFLDQHVEKIALAFCALLFLYGLHAWVASPPEGMAVVTQNGTQDDVGPNKIDDILLRKAGWVRGLVDDAKPQTKTVPNYVPVLVAHANRPFRPEWGDLFDQGLGRLPLTMPQGTVERKFLTLPEVIARIPAPAKPKVRMHRSVADRSPAADRVIAHVSSLYPWRNWQEDWSTLFKGTYSLPTFLVLRTEVRIQELQDDGTWGPARAVPLAQVPVRDAQGNVLQPPAIPAHDGNAETIARIDEAIARFRNDNVARVSWEAEAIEPIYYDLYFWPDRDWLDWKCYLPTTELTALVPKEEPVDSPTGREPARRRTAPTYRRTTPNRTTPSRTPNQPYGPPPPIINRGNDGSVDPMGRPPGADRERSYRTDDMGGSGSLLLSAPRGRGPSVNVNDYERRDENRPGPIVGPRGTDGRTPAQPPVRKLPTVALPARPTPTPVPDLVAQKQHGKVWLWAHCDSLNSGRKYRFQVRLVLLNPLLTKQDDVPKDRPQDARTVEVASPWSEWSDTVGVSEANRFFVTGSFAQRRTVKVTIFSESLGQPVFTNVDLTTGEEISSQQKVSVTVIDPLAGRPVTRELLFDTGAIAVDLDFNKEVPLSGSANRTTKTVELLCVDEDGQLQARLRSLDELSEEYKKLRGWTQIVEQYVNEARTAAASGTGAPPAVRP